MGLYNTNGIYCIKNIFNNRMYIGCTFNCFGDRIDNHFYLLKNHKHHSEKFQKDYDIYGRNGFEVVILEYASPSVDKSYYYDKEIYYINIYNSIIDGYNISSGGEGGYSGVDRPQELIDKISKINKDRLRGTHLSDEVKRKISKSNTGKKMSDEAKVKISKGNSGKTRTLKQKLHLSSVAKKMITNEQAKEIKDMISSGLGPSEIHNITGISISIINDIKRGKSYKLV